MTSGPVSSGAQVDPNAVYALGSSPGESERLLRQSDELARVSAAVLDQVGLGAGASAIDVGCGPSGAIELLAERVSPGGRVVGVDVDPNHVAMAQEFVAEQGLPDVDIVEADAADTGLPASSFDVVHARALLINLPDPAAVVAEMVRLAKPGGWVVGVEPDVEDVFAYPPNRAFRRVHEIFWTAASRNGGDLTIGRRVPEMHRQAGLDTVGVEPVAQTFPPGHPRRAIFADLVESMLRPILDMGLAKEAEVTELTAEARAYLADPDTVAVLGFLFLTWGRKPASASR